MLMMELSLGFVVVLFLLFLSSSKAVVSGKETAKAGSSVSLR